MSMHGWQALLFRLYTACTNMSGLVPACMLLLLQLPMCEGPCTSRGQYRGACLSGATVMCGQLQLDLYLHCLLCLGVSYMAVET